MAPIEVAPASRLPFAELVALFGRAYEGYSVPMHVDEPMLRMMVEVNDEDLDSSVVLLEGMEPVAVALLAVRAPLGWVGGMGVLASHRRRGLGRAVMEALISNARALGLREIWLEVLEQNDSARALYDQLGFREERRVEVWSVPPVSGAAPESWSIEDAAALQGPALEREPWQRAAATRAHLAVRPGGVAHLRLRGDGLEGGLTWRVNGETRSLLDARGPRDAAWWGHALPILLRARGGTSMRLLNVEAGGVLAGAAALAGGTREVGQSEMCLRLA